VSCLGRILIDSSVFLLATVVATEIGRLKPFLPEEVEHHRQAHGSSDEDDVPKGMW